ncbi:MAG: hypothetical protein KTR28_09410 [Micavibrio sp.]|nr:hypothetical protein [Micavibrio sp.]
MTQDAFKSKTTFQADSTLETLDDTLEQQGLSSMFGNVANTHKLGDALRKDEQDNATQVRMGVADGQSAFARQFENSAKAAQKRNETKKDFDFMVLLESIRADIERMERDLAEQYGTEQFREIILADLAEQGIITKEKLDEFQKIADPAERCKAIDDFITEGLKSGDIKRNNLQYHKLYLDLIDANEMENKLIEEAANDILKLGEIPVNTPTNVKDYIQLKVNADDEAYKNIFKDKELANNQNSNEHVVDVYNFTMGLS